MTWKVIQKADAYHKLLYGHPFMNAVGTLEGYVMSCWKRHHFVRLTIDFEGKIIEEKVTR